MAQVALTSPTGGSAEAQDLHFVSTSSTRLGAAAVDPWDDLEHWLSTMGLAEHARKFHDHEITGKEMPFLTEARAFLRGFFDARFVSFKANGALQTSRTWASIAWATGLK